MPAGLGRSTGLRWWISEGTAALLLHIKEEGGDGRPASDEPRGVLG